ncbi:MAG: hypothetical protein EOO77_45410 [Oxalobacteraceae bacterium]|nr:MAG: hypothetical protein EOO77_45410 [Oxalobacteraceae bacterium]
MLGFFLDAIMLGSRSKGVSFNIEQPQDRINGPYLVDVCWDEDQVTIKFERRVGFSLYFNGHDHETDEPDVIVLESKEAAGILIERFNI